MRILAVLTLLPLLAGCSDSDWNNLLSLSGSDQAASPPAQTARAAPPPAATAPVPSSTTGAPITQAQAAATLNPLCLGMARQDAMTNDFDTATQQKVAVRSYQQCQQIFGDAGN